MRDQEHRLQSACVRWFDIQYPNLRPHLFAVPNGGARSPVTGARLKAEGVRPGVSDLILLHPSADRQASALLIEMKTPAGRQSPAQRQWQQALTLPPLPYRYALIRTLPDFTRLIHDYLTPARDGTTSGLTP